MESVTVGITRRLVEFYNELKVQKKVRNASDFADQTKIGQSYFSQVLRGNRTVGLEKITEVAIAFPELSLDWLILGGGGIYRREIKKHLSTEYPPAVQIEDYGQSHTEELGEAPSRARTFTASATAITSGDELLKTLLDFRDCMKDKDAVTKERDALRLQLQECEQRQMRGAAVPADQRQFSTNVQEQPEEANQK